MSSGSLLQPQLSYQPADLGGVNAQGSNEWVLLPPGEPAYEDIEAIWESKCICISSTRLDKSQEPHKASSGCIHSTPSGSVQKSSAFCHKPQSKGSRENFIRGMPMGCRA
eukprot:scaffold68567_cov15-Tisochrysis_lutea.AAC.2